MIGVKMASCEEPGNHRVGVPHVSCPALVPSPDERWDARHEMKEALGDECFVRDSPGTVDCLTDVRDRTVPPAAHLVAEDPEASYDAAADGSGVAAGVLYTALDGVNGDYKAVVFKRDCEVANAVLNGGAGVDAAGKAELTALGIIVR